MQEHHTLGKVSVKAGEFLNLTYNEIKTGYRRHLTVVALVDIDISHEMAEFCRVTDRSGKDIYLDRALPDFIQSLSERKMVHAGDVVNVHIGDRGRPAARLMDEYRFSLNPESYWEAKLVQRYMAGSFTVYNHEYHRMIVLMGVEAPFTAHASIVDMNGQYLGHLHLSVLPDHPLSTLNDEDTERIRLALQADVTLHFKEINVMVEHVELTSNPDFGLNAFKQHLPPFKPSSKKKPQ